MATIRKASGSLKRDEPLTKKQRTSKSASTTKSSLQSALFSNGAPKKLEAKATTASKKTAHAVQDGNTSVSTVVGQVPTKKPIEVVEISSDESSSDEEEEEEEEEPPKIVIASMAGVNDNKATESSTISQTKSNDDGQANTDTVMTSDVEHDNEDKEENSDSEDEPTFGELLAPAPIEVQSLVHLDDHNNSVSHGSRPGPRELSLNSATSLATVLTQALKTNDRDLLESCFVTSDLDSVRSTISRLPSTYIGHLLLYIADKLHKRPGRASSLIVWVQWSLVSHGGYLARREDVVKKLTGLNRVMKERANSLQPLLALKGRLDMLSAQIELRRQETASQRRPTHNDDDDVPIYVEGQENNVKKDSDDDESGDEEHGEESEEDNDEMVMDDATIAAAARELDAEARAADSSDDEDDDDEEEASDAGFSDQELEEDSEPEEREESEDDDLEIVQKPDKGKQRAKA